MAARINESKLQAPASALTLNSGVRVALKGMHDAGALRGYNNVAGLAVGIWLRLVNCKFKTDKPFNADDIRFVLLDLQKAGALSFGGGTGNTGNITRLPRRTAGGSSAIAAAAGRKAS